MFDSFYMTCFNFLKPSFGKKAMTYALYYVSFLEISFYGLLASFFSAFASQMRLGNMSQTKAITITILVALFVCFKNWMRYNGKRRNVLSAKSRRIKLKLWQIIAFPLICLLLAFIFFQAI